MIIEIITIGREILDGRVVDTNSVFFGQELGRLGQVPRYLQRVDDIAGDILNAFNIAASRADVVLVSGGLGPTSDDITAETFAKFVGEPWVEHLAAREQVQKAFARIQRPIHDSQWKQARLAQNARLLDNPHGTAPGFAYESGKTKWFFMPGVPREMKPMFLTSVAPSIVGDADFLQQMWFTQFTSEGELQQRLGSIISALPPEIAFFYRTKFPENHLGLSGSLKTAVLKAAFADAVAKVSKLLGADVFTTDETKTLERLVGDLALARGQHLVTAESCTGGLVASRLTDKPGSSASVGGGFVTYSNEFKIQLASEAGLATEMESSISAHGAVSEQVASLMAQSAAKVHAKKFPNFSVLAVSTTGIAGPDGGSDEKPVGTCWIAVANQVQVLATYKVQARLGLERDQLKLLFSQHALNQLRLCLLRR